MIKQNPFSVYDFLGYLVPGALLIYIFLLVVNVKEAINKAANKQLIINKASTFDEGILDAVSNHFNNVNLDNLLIFIIIAYSIGHLLSFASSISIEKYSNWKYGYPTLYILGNQNVSYFSCPAKKYWKANLWKFVMLIFILPIFLLDLILGSLFGLHVFYAKKLDPELINYILRKVKLLLSKLDLPYRFDSDKFPEFDFHRIVTHYVFENSKQHQARMSNYVALYGFLRNLALIFNILTWYLLYRLILWNGLFYSESDIYLLIIFSLVSYLSFMAFMKFYRRYTLEAFMLLVVDENLVEIKNKN